jgi:Ca-activated chloride channel family protein
VTRLWTLPIAVSLLAAQDGTFRADVKLVRIIATVQDERGAHVGGLSREDFIVTDSGVAQEIAVFEQTTDLPLSVAILVDASGSTAKDLPSEIVSIRAFSKALFRDGNPRDTASLYAFNYEVIQLAPFTRSPARLEAAFKRLRGEAGTSLYDAIQFAAEDLDAREGRRVIVLVTDGGDTTSTYRFHDALRAAHLSDTVVYPIVVVPIRNDAGRNTAGENALQSLAEGTGGRVFQASLGEALDAAFASILRDLRTQYLVGYYPRSLPPAANRFRPVSLTLREGSKLRVSARNGYYESAPPRSSR